MNHKYHQTPKTSELDVVRIVCLINGKVLLVQESDDPNWKLPGGKIHDKETIFEAVIREIKEELGIDVDESQVLNYIAAPIPDSENIRHIFLMKLEIVNFPKTDEVERVDYFDLDALPDTKFVAHIKSAVNLVTS